MKPKRKETRNQKGMILISSYMFLSVLATLSLAFFLRSFFFYNASLGVQRQIKAFNLAETGIDAALVQLKNNASYPGTAGTCIGFGDGCYQVLVENTTDPNVRKVTSTGYLPTNNSNAPGYRQRRVIVYADVAAEPLFDHVIFAQNMVRIGWGAVVDFQPSPEVKGMIGVNVSSAAGYAVELGDPDTTGTPPTINGSIHLGPAAVVTDTDSDKIPDQSPLVYTPPGTSVKLALLSAQKVLTPTSVPQGLPDEGVLSVSSGTVTLSGGDRRYSGINITGTGRVVFTSTVRLYVRGPVNIGGEGIEGYGYDSEDPRNLRIDVTTSDPVTVDTANKNFVGVIYAPRSDLLAKGSGKLHSAIVADKVEVEEGTTVERCDWLDGFASIANSVLVKAWQEA